MYGFHHVGTGHRHEPRQQVGRDQGDCENAIGGEKDAEIDQRVDHADAQLAALSDIARRRQACSKRVTRRSKGAGNDMTGLA